MIKKSAKSKTQTAKSKIKQSKTTDTFRGNAPVKLTDYLAYMPGILMVGMLALMLVLDITTPTAQDTQYEDFKNIFRVFDYTIVSSGAIFLVIAILKNRLAFCLRDYLFSGFLLCALISTFINGLNHDAAFGIPVRYIGVFNMFAFFIVYMKVSGYIERVSFRHTILIGYLIVSDLIALSALYENYIGHIASYQDKTGLGAIFFNSNHYGYFLAMSIMIGIGYYIYEGIGKSVIGAASAGINLVVLMLNNTLGAILAVGLCTIVTVALAIINEVKSNRTITVTICRKSLTQIGKRAFTLAAIGLVTVALAIILSANIRSSISGLFSDIGSILAGTSTGNEGSGRWSQWKTVVQYIKERPFFGFGCEGITRRLMEATCNADAHCEPLTYAAYYGIPGALLYIAGVFATAVKYFRERNNMPSYCRIAFMAASAYFISSLFGVQMFNTAPFFFIFMGMSAEEWKEV